MKRGPQAGSKYAEVRRFFEVNPAEMLSYEDMAAKFGLTRIAAQKICDRMVSEGIAQRGVMVWLDPDRLRA